ncbi:MAG TPA: ABC transporter substrate-binding protein, partial [Stellaceae bacterium]|nr:ABC transporter substrate-binding protein [Stellaceae bacterium]
MQRRSFVAIALSLPIAARAAIRAAAAANGSYGLSLFGELKYPADFTHFDYADPNAPKGGAMRFAAIGTYDTLNPFIIKGVAAAGI